MPRQPRRKLARSVLFVCETVLLSMLRLRRTQVLDYYPDKEPISNHPVYRLARNIERLEKVELNKRLGRAPPKKGEGKRAAVAAKKK